MHGYGVYKFANGHCYEGSWHDGRKQGLGIYTFRNGDTHAGHWHMGTLQTRSTQSPSPSSTTGVNHTKVLHVVQVCLLEPFCDPIHRIAFSTTVKENHWIWILLKKLGLK